MTTSWKERNEVARQRDSAREAQATLILSELEALALRDLGHQTERLRSALARAAPKPRGSKDDAAEQGSGEGEGELAWARLGATEALELWSKVHAACTLARLEASASASASSSSSSEAEAEQQHEDEQAAGQDEEEEQDSDGERRDQRQKDRKHWEHEG